MHLFALPVASVVFAWLCSAESLPTAFEGDVITASHAHALEDRATCSDLPPDLMLRILPLGASVTFGTDSTDYNGYRGNLRGLITQFGGQVNYVGSKVKGTMFDNDVEATPGFRIDQVASEMEKSLPYLPNLVILNSGTNDCVQNFNVSGAAARLGDLMDRILEAVPNTVILVSTLLPNLNTAVEKNIQIFNSMLPAVVAERVDAGKYIMMVDMHDNTTFTTADITKSDGTHPTDAGYIKMSNIWYAGLQKIFEKCWLTAPADSGIPDPASNASTTCEQKIGYMEGPFQTQTGGGSSDDGNYVHIGVSMGALDVPSADLANAEITSYDADGVYWADINGDGLDDYIWVGNETVIGVALNKGPSNVTGNVEFGDYAEFTQDPHFTMYCLRRGVRFADINADGRDDFFCLQPDGNLYAWLNVEGTDPRWPAWQALGKVMSAQKGYLQAQIRLADIDGDGRVDYVGIAANGDITAWRNGGQNSTPAYWQEFGLIFHGNATNVTTDLAGVRFVDINGDGRDDCLFVTNEGAVTSFINQRGHAVGLAPAWLDAGVTHSAVGIGITDQSNVTFGKIWGSKMADYVAVYTKSEKTTSFIKWWRNAGHGGTVQKGDGCRYCDMTGSGFDDYVWMGVNGTMTLFGNEHNPGSWYQWGSIPTPATQLQSDGIKFTRKDIHLADIDGDGKCDFIYVDPSTNDLTVWLNLFNNTKPAWSKPISYKDINCTNHYGIGEFDLAVRFADITGDRRADVICLDLNGRATASLATGSSGIPSNFSYVGQVKLSVGADRSNIRFADINGDGRADYIWLDKYNGSYTAYTNSGPIPAAGSAFTWIPRGLAVAGGHSRGECVNFANLKGVGRADYIDVFPATAAADVWFNVCPGSDGKNKPMRILEPLSNCTGSDCKFDETKMVPQTLAEAIRQMGGFQ